MVLPDRLLINQCFYHFKTLYKNLEKKKGGPSVSGINESKNEAPPSRDIESDSVSN